MVRIPVAIPTAILPQRSIAKEVAREEALKFTMLLPIKMALSILEYWSKTPFNVCARRFPSSHNVRIFIRLTVERAVSEAEKKADNANRTSKMNSLITVSGSINTFLQPFFM